jgi:PAS domain S-box-containing protein
MREMRVFAIRRGRRISFVQAAWVAVGIAAVAIYALGTSSIVAALLFDGLSLGALLAVSARAVRSPPGDRRGWALAGVALLLWFLADAVSDAYGLAGSELPFPSLADPLYLAGYPFLVGAVGRIGRRWTGGRFAASFVDAAVISLAFLVLAWAATGQRVVQDGTQTLAFLTLLAYPTMDLLVLGALIRVFSMPKRASPTLKLLFAALIVQLLVDGIYAATALSYEIGTPLDTGWMLAYVLLGAAALCPPEAPGPPVAMDDALLGRRRLLVVGSATLLGPVGLLVATSVHGFDLHLVVLAGASAILTLLVIGRLADMFRRTVALRATAEDARTRAEQAEQQLAREHVRLVESEERWRALLESVQEILMVVAPDGTLRYVSSSVERWLGHPPDELLGSPLVDLVHAEDADVVARELTAPGATGAALATYRARHRDGSWRTLEGRVSIGHGDPLVDGVLLSARDVSERVALERERELMETERQLSQRLQAVGQLAAGIAHEMNTPIQYVGDTLRFIEGGCTDLSGALVRYREALLAEEPRSLHERRALVRDIDADADLTYLEQRLHTAFRRTSDGLDRVASVVRALKTFDRAPEAHAAAADLNDAVEAVLAVCHSAYAHVADVELDLGELPAVAAAAGDLNHVLLNLVVNAAHAIEDAVAGSARRGVIAVRTALEGGTAVVEVRDDGAGIAADIHGRVFEPFFTTKDVGRGSGQGLSIARTLIARHGGRITFASSSPAGTTFRVEIPIQACSPGDATARMPPARGEIPGPQPR